MKRVSLKNIIYVLVLIIVGIALNRGISAISSLLGLSLYLDSIGTMFSTVIGGVFPGMVVGFASNMIGGLSDSSTFYYGTINVLIALIVGVAVGNGYFDKLYKVLTLIPLFLLLSIPTSLLTYMLFEFQVGENVASPAVQMFHDMGMPIMFAQILGDFCVELPDKLISLIATFFLVKLVPGKMRVEFGRISGDELRKNISEEGDHRNSLRYQIAIGLFWAGLLLAIVAFFISYKTYMEARIAGYNGAAYDVAELRTETLLYSGKLLSVVLGLLLCIVSFAMVVADHTVVKPLHTMAREMRHYAYDIDGGRDKSYDKIKALDIHTGNEIEELYVAMSKTVKEVDDYIDKTNEQAETISALHVNIITTLADIVESRDKVTGHHVKRTAEYCRLIAEELRREGKYTDILTDEYIETLSIAAPLHDIGKIHISDAILNKKDRLTPQEFDDIKTHPGIGMEMLISATENLGDNAYMDMAKDIAYYHHEWYGDSDRGYPAGLTGDDIPLAARIMAVADVFDALVAKRPYKDGMPVEKAIKIIIEEKGTHFDPDIVDAFLNIQDKVADVIEMYGE